MDEGVRLFLENIGMLKYYDIFCARGFDLEADIPHINLFDLENSLMIESRADRAVIYANAQNYKPSTEYNLFEWLHRHSLDHYYINFIQSELTDLNAIARIQLPNEDLYDELEIVLPGHKKRLERAVASLREEGIGHLQAETPVTQGWWGKPDCLPQAKFDFLCVSANLCASQQPENKVRIDFMVDSGSDVSTVQEKTLENLNLELIGTVYSCGIHGGNYTNLYKAQLEVGPVKLDIEVLASNYDSLGSRIVRHFRHVIDGKKHIWLKGNYRDPLPVILPSLSSAKSSSVTCTGLINPSETQPSITQASLPCLPSVSSTSSSIPSENVCLISSPDNDDTKSENFKQQAGITQSQNKPELQSSSKIEAIEHHHIGEVTQNLHSSYQECSTQKAITTLNSFIPLLSANSSNQIKFHSLNNSSNTSDHDSSTTNSVQTCENGSMSIGTKEESSSHHPSTIVTSVACDQEKSVDYEKEDNNLLFCFNEKRSQKQLDTSDDFKSAGHKRQNSLSLDHISKPRKIQKADSVDSSVIPPNLRDTDDDIDNINPIFISDINHSNNYKQRKLHSNSHAFYRPVSSSVHTGNVVWENISNSENSTNENVSQEEIIHILNHSDDEEESHLQDGEGCDKELEIMRQKSNFMPGVGTSVVIIPVDDLEENKFIRPSFKDL